MKRRLIRLAGTLVVTGLCAAYIFWKIDVGRTVHVLVHANFGYFAASVAIVVLSVLPMAWRWQRLLAAKGIEDTAFYLYNRLQALNEVGSWPEQFGQTCESFHQQNSARLAKWPHSLLTTSTHDTKLSEDVRARLAVISELPGEWRSVLGQCREANHKLKRLVKGKLVPDANEEYLLYQILLGTWPFRFSSKEEKQLWRALRAGRLTWRDWNVTILPMAETKITLDQVRHVAAENDQQQCRGAGQQHNPIGEGEAVALERELAGHELVFRQDGGQAREVSKTRVRGEEQHQRRRRLVGVVQDVVAEYVPAEQRDDRLLLARHQSVAAGQERHADEDEA